jgi:3-phosphoglycerate kinase
MILKTVKDINLKNKRVLVRVDYNVSLGQADLADQLRLRQSLPTINYLLSQNCLVILISHLGRPGGEVKSQYSLKPLLPILEKLLKRSLTFFDDFLTLSVQEKIKKLPLGEIILLENLRFYPGEEANEESFSRQLAALAEIFVQDGFGVCHRPHASVIGLPQFLPAVAGLLLAKEVALISKTLKQPQRPMAVVLGGAKTETKIGLLNRLLEIADILLLGGCLANTFLKASGYEVGQSKVDKEACLAAQQILTKAKALAKPCFLPLDVVLGDMASNFVNGQVSVNKIQPQLQILDIGSETRQKFSQILKKAKTIIWNGPLGLIEQEAYRGGTQAVYQAIAENKHAVALIGGGETLTAINQKITPSHIYLSTGGGAMLEFIEKGTLVGIEVLLNK